MALTLHSFFGCETGSFTTGTEQFRTSQGTITADSAIKRSGGYSCKLTGNATLGLLSLYLGNNGTTSGGNDHIFGFGLRLAVTNFTTLATIFAVVRGGANDFKLRMDTNGDLVVTKETDVELGRVLNPFAVNTFYFIEIKQTRDNTVGSIILHIDGVEKVNVSTVDTQSIGTPNIDTDSGQWQSGTVTGEDIWIDDFYYYSGATSVSEFLGVNTHVSTPYQKTDGTATDVGSTLTAGTWANNSELPGSEANTSNYGLGLAGGMTCSTGTRAGPSGDANLSGSTIKGMLGTFWAKRSAGAGSTHNIRMGNNVDGMTDRTVTLSTSFANYFFCSELSTIVPLLTEYAQLGYSVGAGGGQTMTVSDIWAMILYVSSPAAGSDGNFFLSFQ